MVRTKRKLALQTQTVQILDLEQVKGGGVRARSQCTYEQSGCINQ